MRGLWQCYKSAGDVLIHTNRQFGTICPIEDVIIIVISQTLTVGLKFRQKCLLQTVMQKEDFYPHFSPGWKYIDCKYSINTVKCIQLIDDMNIHQLKIQAYKLS